MYTVNQGHTVKNTKDGPLDLANFAAEITQETRYIDDSRELTILTIEGQDANERDLPQVKVPADKFGSMNWIMSAWGTRAVIMPHPSAERDVRTAIMLRSDPKRTTIYTHTGWRTNKNDQPIYLDANGAITPDGKNHTLIVELPHELANYSMTPNEKLEKEAITASLDLRNLAPHHISWPLLAATYRPIIGPVDFALHLTGKTGTYKSEYVSLMQSHYGERMDARNLPGSWSSTANALEAQAYKCKNAIFVIDDFVPHGTSWQVRALQKTVDQLIRGQGNQAGRARLTDTSNLQTTMYPRGLILSTGEDTPVGHSIRARMLILDLSPGDIETSALTIAQQNRPLYPIAMGNFVQWIAPKLKETQQKHAQEKLKYRDELLDIGHSRTPPTLADLIATTNILLEYAYDTGSLTKQQLDEMQAQATQAIITAGTMQYTYLHEADVSETFLDAIRTILASKAGHFRTVNGGIPRSPDLFGWTEVNADQEMPTYKSHGKTLGWVDWDTDALYLCVTAGWPEVKRFAKIALTKTAMFKRLKDAGLLMRTDESRQRNTVRLKCDGHQRNVLHLAISHVLETQEVPQ